MLFPQAGSVLHIVLPFDAGIGHERTTRRVARIAVIRERVVRAGRGRGRDEVGATDGGRVHSWRGQFELAGVPRRRELLFLPILPRALRGVLRSHLTTAPPLQTPVPALSARTARRAGTRARSARCRRARDSAQRLITSRNRAKISIFTLRGLRIRNETTD